MILDFLRDSTWQFVGAVLALLGIVVAYRLYALQAQYKELAIGLLSTRKLIQIDERISERVAITLDGSAITSVNLYLVGLKNSGTAPILLQDFLRPINIDFPEGQKVISATIARQWPSTLDLSLQVDNGSVKLNPGLLNPLDEAEVQILASSSDQSPEISFRIIGVSAASPIHVLERSDGSKWRTTTEALLFVTTLIIIPLILTLEMPKVSQEGIPALHVVLFSLSCVLLSTGFGFVRTLFVTVGKRWRRTLRET